ncbi:MAG: hypothetical protein IT383_07385 [Deltaproteobacteria bacterium]|nr:hypothetical protein [Deltaproteobacteria bacterium]
MLVVVVDGNCVGHAAKQREIAARVDDAIIPRVVIGCPDPHVERWLLADPVAFQKAVGAGCPADPNKCERDRYKHVVAEALANASVPLLTGVMELAPDVVEAMDFYSAGTHQASIKSFVDDLGSALQQLDDRAKNAPR